MYNLKIKLEGDHQWYTQGDCVLEDFMSAIRRKHIKEVLWGKFLFVKTVIDGFTGYTLWVDGTAWLDRDRSNLIPIIHANL